MLVKKYMTSDPICLSEEVSVTEASSLMKEKGMRRFPVMRGSELIGIVVDRDLRSAAPSMVITLDQQERELLPELYNLLCNIKIKDIMSKKVMTIVEDDTVIKAAYIMVKKKISSLPVLNSQGMLVGIITESDIFGVLLNISGVTGGRVLMGFRLGNQPGSIKEVADVIRGHGSRVVSILCSDSSSDDSETRDVYIRIEDIPEDSMTALKTEAEKKFTLLMAARDNFDLGFDNVSD